MLDDPVMHIHRMLGIEVKISSTMASAVFQPLEHGQQLRV
jgi:hypothetical protein